MYEQKVGRAYRRGCGMMLAVYVVGGALGLALVVSVLLLIDGGRVEPRSTRFTLALLVPYVMMAGVLGVAATRVAWRARKLDRAFERWGWKGRQWGAVLRSWHGELDGRAVDIWFFKGPTLEIYLACRPSTRGTIHFGGPLIRAIGEALDGHPPLHPAPVDLEGASFYCYDEGWMRSLFEDGSARSALRSLMTDTTRTSSAVSFVPNAVRYLRRYPRLDEINAESVDGWLTQLGRLAGAIDSAGPSGDALEPKRLEEWARTERGKYLNRFLLVLAVLFVAANAALFAFSWLFVGQ